ncbi:MAG: hypothetical protein IJ010_05395 [Ruminococcus sp.]|nr:hypothetical protein [Ruminococcus sp.]
MERSKLMGLIIAVLAAVLMAIAGKSCTVDAKKKNPPVQRPTIVVSPQIVQGDGYTPPPADITTAAPVPTAPPEPDTYDEIAPPTETGSKSKLDLLWEQTAQ